MLDEFRSIYINWDRANNQFHQSVVASSGDANGRKLVVRITNAGQVEDLTGASLSLFWEHQSNDTHGLDGFSAKDASRGVFELAFTTEMLTNEGTLNARLKLVTGSGVIESRGFNITVFIGSDTEAVESSDSFTALTKALVDVQNLEQNYAPRLNEVTAQLAQKINKGEVSVYDIDKNRGKFDSSYFKDEFLKELSEVSVYDIDKNRGKFDSTYFKDEFLKELSNGEINTTYLNDGSVTTPKLADGSVITHKVDFINNRGKNITDEAVKTMGIISSNPSKNHRFIPEISPQSHTFVTQVKENVTYKIQVLSPENWDRTRVVVYQNEPVLDEPAIEVAIVDDNYKDDIIFTPSQSGYLAFELNSQNIEVPFVLTENYAKPYIDDDIVELKDNSVSPEKTTFIEISDKNLTYDSFYKDGFIAYRDPESYPTEMHTFRQQDIESANARVRFIPIESDTTYTLTIAGESNRNRYALATNNLEPTSDAIDLYPEFEIIFDDDGNDSPFSFTSKPDSSYLVLYLHTEGYETPVQLEKGDTSTEYEYPAHIKTELIPTEIKKSHDSIISMRKHDFFYKSESIPDMRSSLGTTKKDFVYGLYDELVDKYPELVSKKTLGYGYNTSGEIDESFPIYEYTFSPAQTLQMSQDEQSTLLTMPKSILLTSGIHGDEKAAVYGLYEMFKQMLENPQRNYRVNNLKNSYVFKVIPLVSPGGYDINTRINPIDVNINRDFASLQAVETQIVVDWWQENADAFGYFDVHNFWRDFGGRTPTSTSYHLSGNPEVDDVFSKFIRNASDDWYYNYMAGYQDKGKIAYGFNQSNVYKEVDTSNNIAYHDYGFEISGLIESARQDPDQISVQNTSATLELSVEAFMNYLLAIHDRFGD